MLKAWLFDLYPVSDGITLWFIDNGGEKLQLLASFQPYFYISGPARALGHILRFFTLKQYPIRVERTEKKEFKTGKEIPVLKVRVENPLLFSRIVRDIAWVGEDINLYNADIPLAQVYFYETGLFPLAYCELEYSPDKRLLSITPLDSPWDTNYQLPPLSILYLKLEGELINPAHGKSVVSPSFRFPQGKLFDRVNLVVSNANPSANLKGRLEVVYEGRDYLLGDEGPQELLSTLNSILKTSDPDIILSHWGDSFILPKLCYLSERYGIPLNLNRDPQQPVGTRPSRSYFSYGRIVYRGGWQITAGRWHIDLENSFIIGETGLEGLFELSRLTKIPVQPLARTSTGTGITSMQLETAYRHHILIPWRKREPEAFKSALELMVTDKGGLVYLPEPGFYEEVAEIDFSSMYPTLITKFNISPETVGCLCCSDNLVPEIEYSICKQRRGLVPRTLGPILAKRARYKALIRETGDPQEKEFYEKRQKALKWLLVVCFGYLGYKNARFGRIEAHEATTAYGREKLLEAKEIAEARGFHLIHAIVDSLWLKKACSEPFPSLPSGQALRQGKPCGEQCESIRESKGAANKDYEELVEAISKETGIPIALEGVYRWIGFLPSRTDPKLPVPNRFYGVFYGGGIKVRGLELRRSDTPPLVREAQGKMLEILAQAKNRQEYQEKIPAALDVLQDYLLRLKAGEVELKDLVITKHISQNPWDYQKDNLVALVAKELLGHGIRLSPGEEIQYVITAASSRVKTERARAYSLINPDQSYDVEKYAELLLRAGESLLSLFGYNLERLRGIFNGDATTIAI